MNLSFMMNQVVVNDLIVIMFTDYLKLVFELDGDVHNLPEQKEYDLQRQKSLEEYRIKFLRITNEEFLGNPNKAFSKIEKKISTISKKETSSCTSFTN
jgi:very-short-patch-repair endonuclease